MNYGIILYTIGWVLMAESACMLLPLLCGACYADYASVRVFGICAILCLAVGLVLARKRPKSDKMYSREGFVAVALCWIVISIFGALPFVISGYIPNFVDALFETVSGFTTTGSSILTDVEALPKALLFWRSFTHWIGGMGVLVFVLAILPHSDGSDIFLIKAESPGPAVGKMVPKVRSMAKILYMIYAAMTFVEIILLLLGGMDLFDALTMSFGTAGTGGFGIRNSSVADYSSYCQIVITVFMILFGIDFSVYYLILKRKFSTAFRSEEYRYYLGIIAVAITIIAIDCRSLFPNFATTLKHSAFQVASVITTTGYATSDFNEWHQISRIVLVLLMFIGACAGSTGGGMKVSRIIIFFKSARREIHLAAHPRSTQRITINDRAIEHETSRSVIGYLAAFLLIFGASLLVISHDNFDFTTNFTAVATTINNIGPGLGMVGPTGNFSQYSALSKLVFIFDMLIGRLEIFPMLMLLSPSTWRK